MMKEISPAVKTETIRIGVGSAIATVLMWIVFLILHWIYPGRVPFDYTVILGGLCGCAVAVGNFFLMGLGVQKVAAESDEKLARQRMQISQRQRFLLMLIWGIAALAAPCFNGAAGIIPLLFPGTVIKIYYLTLGKGRLQGDSGNAEATDRVTEKGSEE